MAPLRFTVIYARQPKALQWQQQQQKTLNAYRVCARARGPAIGALWLAISEHSIATRLPFECAVNLTAFRYEGGDIRFNLFWIWIFHLVIILIKIK